MRTSVFTHVFFTCGTPSDGTGEISEEKINNNYHIIAQNCILVAGNFRETRFSRAEQLTRKLNWEKLLRTVFHMQSSWWVWFPGIEM